MAMMGEMDKKEKRAAKANAVNPLIANSAVVDMDPARLLKSGADKVPVEAGMVHDAEGNSKMVADLTKQLR